MQRDESWPEPLARYKTSDGALLLRPQGLVPGQLPLLVIFGLAAIVGVIGLVAASGERLECLGLLVVSLAILAIPVGQLLRWTRIARTEGGWRVENGTWHWRGTSAEIPRVAIQTALVVKDEKGYRLEFPVYEHVRVAFKAKPFNAPPPAVEIAELFRLDRVALDALTDALAPSRDVTSEK